MFLTIHWFINKKAKERKEELKKQIMRHFEDSQRKVNGSYYQTEDLLLSSCNFIKENESEIAIKVLRELVN